MVQPMKGIRIMREEILRFMQESLYANSSLLDNSSLPTQKIRCQFLKIPDIV